MTLNLRIVALLAGCALMGAVIAMAAGGTEMVAIALLPLAILAVGVLVIDPFWPLLLLVLSVPLDALASRIFSVVPVSATAALTLLTVASLLLKMPREPRSQRLGPDDPTVRWGLAFAVAFVISMLLANDQGAAREAASRMGGMLLVTLLIVRIVSTKKQVRIMMLCLVAAALFSGTILVLETQLGIRLIAIDRGAMVTGYGHLQRSSGASNENPTTAALMLTTGVIMALVLALEYPKARMLTVSAVIMGLGGVIFSYARSAALVFAAMALVIAWRHRRSRYFALGLIICFALAVIAAPFVPESYWVRLATLGNFDTDYTLWRRLGYNLIGLDLFSEYPLFGIGPGNFSQYYVDSDYRYMPGRTLTPRLLHNLYLSMAVEVGLAGLVPFLAMIGSGFIRLTRAVGRSTDDVDRAFGAALLFAFTAFLIGSIVTPVQFLKYTWILIGLAAVQARVMGSANSSAEE